MRPQVAHCRRMMVGTWRIVVLVSLLWDIFEIFYNNYKKEDFDESDVNEWTFFSPLDAKWNDGGLRAWNMFAEEQISSLECFVKGIFRDFVWLPLASF